MEYRNTTLATGPADEDRDAQGREHGGASRRKFLMAGAGVAASLALRPTSKAWAQAAGDAQDLTRLTLAEASRLVRRRDVSPVELTQACLQRIERLNPALNAFITIEGEKALADARRIETEIGKGVWHGPLHGVPIALKDNMDTAGVRTTGASALFEDRVPTEDSEVARRLKAAGSILLGKLNLNEFAYGGSSTATHFGTMHNPWNLEHATGGSSGGSGAAVAADLCYAALGTDTAGSVRMPASHCGIVGLKPSYGRVSTRGVMMLSWTLDHVGPMCKSVEDAALMLGVIAGRDPLEPTSSDAVVPDYAAACNMPVKELRLGIPRTPYYDELDPEVEGALEAAIDVLRSLTAGTRRVQLPAAVSGARLWGPEAYAYHEPWFTVSPEKYQPGTRASLERYAHADALDYVKARREVDLARQNILGVFGEVDLLITPVMRTPAPLIAVGGGGGSSANAADFDVFGIPAIAVPCGFSSTGLPIGMQIAGAPFQDDVVLALAHAYEQATGWRSRKPPL